MLKLNQGTQNVRPTRKPTSTLLNAAKNVYALAVYVRR